MRIYFKKEILFLVDTAFISFKKDILSLNFFNRSSNFLTSSTLSAIDSSLLISSFRLSPQDKKLFNKLSPISLTGGKTLMNADAM